MINDCRLCSFYAPGKNFYCSPKTENDDILKYPRRLRLRASRGKMSALFKVNIANFRNANYDWLKSFICPYVNRSTPLKVFT